jgi:serine O-acetyltransferase
MADFVEDRRRYSRWAWFTDRTIYAVAWMRVGQAVEELPLGQLRTLGCQLHSVGHMFVCAFTGVDIARGAKIGPGLLLLHGDGIVMNACTVVGRDAVLLHGVTLGQRVSTGDAPIIGDRCEIGAHAQVLGSISIGDDVRIGAGAVVIHTVPNAANVAGNPARVTRIRS